MFGKLKRCSRRGLAGRFRSRSRRDSTACATLGSNFIVGPRLGDVVHRAILESGASHFDRTVSGDQDNGKLRIAAVNLLEHVETVAVRQAHVQQEKVIGMLLELFRDRTHPFRAGYTVALTS